MGSGTLSLVQMALCIPPEKVQKTPTITSRVFAASCTHVECQVLGLRRRQTLEAKNPGICSRDILHQRNTSCCSCWGRKTRVPIPGHGLAPGAPLLKQALFNHCHWLMCCKWSAGVPMEFGLLLSYISRGDLGGCVPLAH